MSSERRRVLLETWEGADVARLEQEWGLPLLRVVARTTSTNDVARREAEKGAAAGATIIAEEQTSGRGRRGRAWHAPAGSALLLSMVLRPRIGPGGEIGTIPLRVGLGVAMAIERLTGLPITVKWPNDILVSGRKIAGILCEASITGSGSFVIAGIGINVQQSADDFETAGLTDATSLRIACDAEISRLKLAREVIQEVLTLSSDAGPLAGAIARELASRDFLAGKEVTVDGEPAGVACGLSADGALFVRRSGAITTVHSGTVRPVNPLDQ